MSEETCEGCAPFWRGDPDEGADEPEGVSVPAGLEVVDSHVHLFPAGLFEAIWRWFDQHAWKIRHRLHAEEVVEFLRARGVRRFCALTYSHKPGLATPLNEFVAEAARAHPEILPLGTVMPGEPGARQIADDAFRRLGMRGLKLHCHVQRIAADDPRMDPIYEACVDAGRPVVIHAGREPSFPGYAIDPHAICNADRVDDVLRRHPKLVMVVPHLGADEFDAYRRLLDVHENLWLDTTMAVGDYFAIAPPEALFPGRSERLLYGTDFPNVPYAWDRELKKIVARVPNESARAAILGGNALRLFD